MPECMAVGIMTSSMTLSTPAAPLLFVLSFHVALCLQLFGAGVLDAGGPLQRQGGADRVQRQLLQGDLGGGVPAAA